MNSGIYKIVNLINNKFYIGSSLKITHRWAVHRHQLVKNKHVSKHLQRSWNKYGADNFRFEVLEYCDKNQLLSLEQFYMDTLKPEYNLAPIAGSTSGIKFSNVSRKKMAAARTGYVMSEETKLKLSSINKGKKLSEKHKKKLSIAKSRKAYKICALTGQIIEVFTSVLQASTTLNISRNTIYKSFQTNVPHKGYFWKIDVHNYKGRRQLLKITK